MKTITLASNPLTVYTYEEMIADDTRRKSLVATNPIGEWQEDEEMNIIVSDLVEELENQGFSEVKIMYDLSCSQGSGACFDFSDIDIVELSEKVPALTEVLDPYIETVRFLIDYDSFLSVKTTRNSFANHYCHSKTRNLEYISILDELEKLDDQLLDFEYEKKRYPIIRELLRTQSFSDFITDVVNTLEEVYQDKCHYIYRKLQKHWDYLHSESYCLEEVKSMISPNAMFLSNGRVIDELPRTYSTIELKPLEEYVLIDQDGKVLSFTTSDLDKDFIDTVDDSDLGKSKALVFTTISELAKELQNMTGYSLIPVSEAFKSVEKENKENANS